MNQLRTARRSFLGFLAGLPCAGLILADRPTAAAEKYDLLLRGGHVIDPKNEINARRDVAIRDGKIAAVAPNIDPSSALKTVDLPGLYVTPGLIDPHVHIYGGTGERSSYAGDNSVYPDGFTFRSGVTTVVDAGCAGWRNFDDFKARVIDGCRTRVFVMLNIVGHGMRGPKFEQDLEDMQAKPTAHYMGPEFTPVERAVEAGTLADIPVMVDFGRAYLRKSIEELLGKKLRRG